MTFLSTLLIEFTILLLSAGSARVLLVYLGREFIGVSGVMGVCAYAFVVGVQAGYIGLALPVLSLLVCIALIALIDSISDDQGFALATLVITLCFAGIVRNIDMVGGVFGLQLIGLPRISDYFLIALAAALSATAAMYASERALRQSYLGRAALVVKAYRAQSASLNMSPIRLRAAIVAIGLLHVWFAAIIYAMEYAFVAPESFSPMPALMALIIALISRQKSFATFYLCALVMHLVDLLVRYIAFTPEHVGNLRMIVFGAVIVLASVYRRFGR